MSLASIETQLEFSGMKFPVSRPHTFGLVIDRPMSDKGSNAPEDYLHEILLSPVNRDSLLRLIDDEGLVVCRNVVTDALHLPQGQRQIEHRQAEPSRVLPSRRLQLTDEATRGRNPLPTSNDQSQHRHRHRTIARDHPRDARSKLDHMQGDDEITNYRNAFAGPESEHPSVEEWDRIQGKVTRRARKELTAEACRAYFRDVDRLCNAYAVPWEMGESRLMLNTHDDLTRTMQHRRAYQKPRETTEQNGSLVKRWTAEEA